MSQPPGERTKSRVGPGVKVLSIIVPMRRDERRIMLDPSLPVVSDFESARANRPANGPGGEGQQDPGSRLVGAAHLPNTIILSDNGGDGATVFVLVT